MRFYYVDPTNTALIDGPYPEGSTNVELPDGRTIARIEKAVPEWDLYEGYDSGITPATEYHALERTDTTFEGVVKDPAARVREDKVYVQTAIDDLLAEREDELAQMTRQVLDQGVHVSSIPDDLATDADSLDYYTAIGLCALPSSTGFVVVNLWGTFTTVRKQDADDVWTSVALLYAAALANTNTHRDGLLAAHAADDWDALAAYDMTTGWPPAPTPPT